MPRPSARLRPETTGSVAGVNFAAHAAVAARCSPAVDVRLGAVLPDISAILGVRLRRPNEALDAGIATHYATDSAFHASGWFTNQMKICSTRLQAAGVGRGPARAAAHVGVELLLDGAVLANDDTFRDVWSQLAAPAALVRDAVHDDERDDWIDRLGQFTTRLDPWRYSEPDYAAARIEGMLRHRPRLRLETGQASIVAVVLRSIASGVAADAEQVVDDIAAVVANGGVRAR